MNRQDVMVPGIEVHEQVLNSQEQGFLASMFEAWANRTLTEAEFRLLIAQVTETDAER
jgi:hypothetical protein